MYLLDTHYLIWAMYEPEKMSSTALKFLNTPEAGVFFSSVSIFEIEIKKSLGKLKIQDHFHRVLIEAGFQELPVLSVHAELLGNLPNKHKDPFDRLLIAQAWYEDLTFLTQDKNILQYKSAYKKLKSF